MTDFKPVLQSIAQRFASLDIDQIMSCFTQDVVVYYNQLPTIEGASALREFLAARYQGLADYEISKTIKIQKDNWLGVEVNAAFTKDGQRSQSRIFEFLEFDGDKIKTWDYVGNSVTQ